MLVLLNFAPRHEDLTAWPIFAFMKTRTDEDLLSTRIFRFVRRPIQWRMKTCCARSPLVIAKTRIGRRSDSWVQTPKSKRLNVAISKTPLNSVPRRPLKINLIRTPKLLRMKTQVCVAQLCSTTWRPDVAWQIFAFMKTRTHEDLLSTRIFRFVRRPIQSRMKTYCARSPLVIVKTRGGRRPDSWV